LTGVRISNGRCVAVNVVRFSFLVVRSNEPRINEPRTTGCCM
jgi:hypothetical protein